MMRTARLPTIRVSVAAIGLPGSTNGVGGRVGPQLNMYEQVSC